MAAQVLVSLGADLDRVRQRVLQVLLVSPVQGEFTRLGPSRGPGSSTLRPLWCRAVRVSPLPQHRSAPG